MTNIASYITHQRNSGAVSLLQQLNNVLIQPISLQLLSRHVLGSVNPSFAVVRTAIALERLIHLPLRAGVKEGHGLAFPERPVVHHPDFHLGHVEHHGRTARVVAVDEVGVELNVLGAVDLHRGVSLLRDDAGTGDAGEQGARGQGDARDGTGCEGLVAALHVQSVC